MNEVDRYSSDGLIHDNARLAELQALPLHRKIGITIARITEWYKAFDGNIFVSLSGGKDSTVLWDIVHKLFPDVPAVFSNTGLEYPEISEFAKGICTDVVSPKMAFTEVIKNYGYPIISKEVSEAIYYARRNAPPERERERTTAARQNGNDWNSLATDRQSAANNIGQTNNLETNGTAWNQTNLFTGRMVAKPHTHTHRRWTDNLQKAIRVTWRKTRHIFRRRTCGERCLWVASIAQTGQRNLSLTRRSGCLWSTPLLKSPITAAM